MKHNNTLVVHADATLQHTSYREKKPKMNVDGKKFDKNVRINVRICRINLFEYFEHLKR